MDSELLAYFLYSLLKEKGIKDDEIWDYIENQIIKILSSTDTSGNA